MTTSKKNSSSKTMLVTCPCGEKVTMGRDTEGDWDVCDVTCPKCGRISCGGNGRTGEIADWMTARAAAAAEANYAAQQFSSDMNEWYGRGNHPF